MDQYPDLLMPLGNYQMHNAIAQRAAATRPRVPTRPSTAHERWLRSLMDWDGGLMVAPDARPDWLGRVTTRRIHADPGWLKKVYSVRNQRTAHYLAESDRLMAQILNTPPLPSDTYSPMAWARDRVYLTLQAYKVRDAITAAANPPPPPPVRPAPVEHTPSPVRQYARQLYQRFRKLDRKAARWLWNMEDRLRDTQTNLHAYRVQIGFQYRLRQVNRQQVAPLPHPTLALSIQDRHGIVTAPALPLPEELWHELQLLAGQASDTVAATWAVLSRTIRPGPGERRLPIAGEWLWHTYVKQPVNRSSVRLHNWLQRASDRLSLWLPDEAPQAVMAPEPVASSPVSSTPPRAYMRYVNTTATTMPRAIPPANPPLISQAPEDPWGRVGLADGPLAIDQPIHDEAEDERAQSAVHAMVEQTRIRHGTALRSFSREVVRLADYLMANPGQPFESMPMTISRVMNAQRSTADVMELVYARAEQQPTLARALQVLEQPLRLSELVTHALIITGLSEDTICPPAHDISKRLTKLVLALHQEAENHWSASDLRKREKLDVGHRISPPSASVEDADDGTTLHAGQLIDDDTLIQLRPFAHRLLSQTTPPKRTLASMSYPRPRATPKIQATEPTPPPPPAVTQPPTSIEAAIIAVIQRNNDVLRALRMSVDSKTYQWATDERRIRKLAAKIQQLNPYLYQRAGRLFTLPGSHLSQALSAALMHAGRGVNLTRLAFEVSHDLEKLIRQSATTTA